MDGRPDVKFYTARDYGELMRIVDKIERKDQWAIIYCHAMGSEEEHWEVWVNGASRDRGRTLGEAQASMEEFASGRMS